MGCSVRCCGTKLFFICFLFFQPPMACAVELGSWLIHEICIQEYLVMQHLLQNQNIGAVKDIKQEQLQAIWAYKQANSLREKVSDPAFNGENLNGDLHLLKNQQFMTLYLKQREFPMREEAYQERAFPEQSKMPHVQAVLAMKERRYGFVLNVLIQLMKKDKSWGILYNKVQRIYSINEKGAGQTALSW
ncbi:MAG: hypothetical protein AB8C84_00395 [Oligoflexales bacterium]